MVILYKYSLKIKVSVLENLSAEKHLTASVINVQWERINLYIDVKIEHNDEAFKGKKLDFYLVNNKLISKAHFRCRELGDGVFRLYLNITNPGYNRCLPRGTYSVRVCCEDSVLAICVTDTSIVKKLGDFSRSFLFGNRGKGYNVVFYVDDSDDTALPFIMYAMASSAISVGAPNPISLSPSESAPNKKSSFMGRFISKIFGILMRIIRGVKAKFFGSGASRAWVKKYYKKKSRSLKSTDKTILFMSEQNPSITANQKAVYEKMLQRGLDKEWEIMHSFRSAASEKQSSRSWKEFIDKVARSSVIILDDHAPVFDWLILSPETKVIQLWHAGAGFKSSGYSRWGNSGCPSPFSCHRQYSYGIAGSKHIAHFFSEVWGINTEQVLPTGMPRMDEYLDDAYKARTMKRLYELYPACKGKKVILFAPTYRGKNKAEAHYPYSLIDFDALYETCADEYVVFFKMHPWVAEGVPIPEEYSDKFFDVGAYPNINDLFYITYLLITDYSSNIFEYSLMRNPMLFFAYDEIQYSFSRGFHRDYEESAPGKIVHTFDELIKAIKEKDFQLEKVEKYVEEHFDYIDSGASDRVIDWLILGNMPEDMRKSIDDVFEDVKKTARLDFSSGEGGEGND